MTVLVYGATGHAGTQVARYLLESGVPLVLAGRSRDRLEQQSAALRSSPPVRVAALDDRAALAEALRGIDVVVGCAGPFAALGSSLSDAAVEAGAHYLDISGEHHHLAKVFARPPPRGTAVCPGLGAKGALGDWGAWLLAGALGVRSAESIAVAYAHQARSYWSPSPAALRSIAGEGVRWEAARPADHGPPPREFPFPPPFRPGMAVLVSGTESITLGRTLPTASVRTYLAMEPGGRANALWSWLHEPALAPLTQRAAPLLWQAALSEPAQRLVDALPGPPETGRRAMAVVVEIVVGGQRHHLGMVVEDPHALTAQLVALGIERLYAAGSSSRGLLTPSQLCPPMASLRRLRRSGALEVLRRPALAATNHG